MGDSADKTPLDLHCLRGVSHQILAVMGSSSSKQQEKTMQVSQGPPSAPSQQVYSPPPQGYGPPPQAYGHGAPLAGPMGGYEAPPAYTATPQVSICSAAPGQAAYPKAPAGGYAVPAPAPQVGPVTGQFDAGARFTANNPPSIPPPPPGVAPTAVQAAAMQGQQVAMGQKEGGVL